jgi:hypothetical protein
LIDTDIWIDILRGEIGYPLTLVNWREARRPDGGVSWQLKDCDNSQVAL